MKAHFDIQDNIVKGLDIRLTPVEGLTLHSALLQFTHELSNNENDRITALRMCDVLDRIKTMPSADRPQGEWIDKGKNLWKCSNCEMVIYSESEQELNEFHKWCSRCRAKMKGADDDL